MWEFPSSTYVGVILVVSHFDNIRPHSYEVIAHRGANFHFSHDYYLLWLSLYATNAMWPCIANGWVKFPSLWANREGWMLESGWEVLHLVYGEAWRNWGLNYFLLGVLGVLGNSCSAQCIKLAVWFCPIREAMGHFLPLSGEKLGPLSVALPISNLLNTDEEPFPRWVGGGEEQCLCLWLYMGNAGAMQIHVWLWIGKS